MKLRLFFLFVVLTISGCRNKDPKLAQYLVQGERLYGEHCSNCHQKDGKGFGLLYPPLAGTDFLKGNKEKVICIIRNGMSGPMTVNGQVYDQAMPANEKLTDLEIAEIVTYIYNEWEGEEVVTDGNEVRRVTERCGERF